MIGDTQLSGWMMTVILHNTSALTPDRGTGIRLTVLFTGSFFSRVSPQALTMLHVSRLLNGNLLHRSYWSLLSNPLMIILKPILSPPELPPTTWGTKIRLKWPLRKILITPTKVALSHFSSLPGSLSWTPLPTTTVVPARVWTIPRPVSILLHSMLLVAPLGQRDLVQLPTSLTLAWRLPVTGLPWWLASHGQGFSTITVGPWHSSQNREYLSSSLLPFVCQSQKQTSCTSQSNHMVGLVTLWCYRLWLNQWNHVSTLAWWPDLIFRANWNNWARPQFSFCTIQ